MNKKTRANGQIHGHREITVVWSRFCKSIVISNHDFSTNHSRWIWPPFSGGSELHRWLIAIGAQV